MNSKRIFNFVITFIFILTQVFVFGIPVQADNIFKAPMTLTKTASIANARINDEITLNYTIQPGTLNAPHSAQNKEIVLVMDTSGSMNDNLKGRNSRLTVAKAAANRFIDKFNTDGNVKIGLVQYSKRANIKSGLVDKNSFDELKNSINGFSADGGTNTGDGLRLSYHMLKKSSDSNAKKYIVLLTDGEPTFYSCKNGTDDFVTSDIESGYYTNSSNDELTGLNYANIIAKMIAEDASNINSFMIGCTLSKYGTNTLKEIASKAKGDCSFALTAEDIDAVYSQLADQIKNELPVNSMKFQETLPAGIEIKQVPAGFTVSGQTITGELGSIPYKLISGTNNYTADPLNFQVKVKATKTGTFPLSKDSGGASNSFITYKDIDNTDGRKNFDSVNVTISNPTASINLGRTVDKTNIKVNDKFKIDYNIQPQDIPVEDIDPSYEKGSDIVLVMDTSGSMADRLVYNSSDAKIKVAKDTADNFISKFKGNSNINVALVKFGSTAEKVELNNRWNSLIFANLGEDNQYDDLHEKINGRNSVLDPDGATNIGDGLRIAYHLLNNSADKNRKKYIILMTDGMPTAFSYNTLYNEYSYNPNPWDSNRHVDYNTEQTDAKYYPYRNYNTDDYGNYSLNYAFTMSDIIKNNTTLNIKPIMIAFSREADVSKLSQIAGRAGGEYKTALSSEDMNSIYTDIAGQIESDFTISDVKFEETFPTGINLKDATVPKGFSVSGQKVTGVLNSISYKLDPTGKVYKPISDPSFSIGNLFSTAAGNYKLGQNQSSFISYKDINKEQTKKYFPEIDIAISETTPPDIEAILTPKDGQPDTYTLTVTSKTVSTNKIVKLEEGSVKDGIQTKIGESQNSLELTFNQRLSREFKKSDLAGNTSLYIKATDLNNKTVIETVSLVAVSKIELPDFEQKNNVRPGNVTFSAEPNATIKSIKVNNKQIVTNQSTGAGEYKSLNVDLKGQNTIDVEITNENSNTTKMILNETVDVAPPIIVSNYIFSNKKIDAKFYSNDAKTISENVNLIWLECDLNSDKKITSNEKITVSTDIVNQLSDIQIPDNFQGKKFLVKAREESGNIGSASPGDNLPLIGTVSYVVVDPITGDTEKYDPKVIINKNVVATVKFDEPDITITNNNGLSTKEFTQNGDFIFEFSNKTGNKGTATAKVNNIDKTSIIKHGVFVNNSIRKNVNENEKILKGFSADFGVEFNVYDKNPDVTITLDEKIDKVTFTLYGVNPGGDLIQIGKTLEQVKGETAIELKPKIEIINGSDFNNHYILVYKIKQNADIGVTLINKVKINNLKEDLMKTKVMELLELE